jgi:hypothetical protein
MTRWKSAFDRVQNYSEWFLIVLMLAAAVMLLFNAPDVAARMAAGTATGPVTNLLGAWGSAIVYAVVWGTEAILLAYAKLTKRQKLRKWTLFAIFITHLFSFVLSLSLRGIGTHIIDNLLITGLSAWLWVRAKLQDEYVEWEDLEHFDE